jgi:hypothetical protein
MGSYIPIPPTRDEFKEFIIEAVKHYGLDDPEGRAEAAYKRVYAGFPEGLEYKAKLIINQVILASLTAEESALCDPLMEKLYQRVSRAADQIFQKVLDARMLAESAKITGEWLQGAEVPDDSPKN